MTYEEYLNQTDPKPFLNVKVKRSECFSISKVFCGEIIVLKIKDEYYSYLIFTGTTLFWTMDEHGNKKAPSVFSLEETAYEKLKARHPELNWKEADDVMQEDLEAAELYDKINNGTFINENVIE